MIWEIAPCSFFGEGFNSFGQGWCFSAHRILYKRLRLQGSNLAPALDPNFFERLLLLLFLSRSGSKGPKSCGFASPALVLAITFFFMVYFWIMFLAELVMMVYSEKRKKIFSGYLCVKKQDKLFIICIYIFIYLIQNSLNF